jgi:hypothetical protein
MKGADIALDSGVRKVHDHLCWVKPMSGKRPADLAPEVRGLGSVTATPQHSAILSPKAKRCVPKT